MGKLHEVLASLPGVNKQAEDITAETRGLFGKQSPFQGFQKTYQTLVEDSTVIPPDGKEIITTVPERLDYTGKAIAKVINIVLTKEETNSSGNARADLSLGGKTVSLSATSLLALEKEIKKIREIAIVIPVYDSAQLWESNSEERKFTFKTAPLPVYRTETMRDFIVVDKATKEHKAQIKEISTTKQVGYYNTVYKTGMVNSAKKAEILNKIDALLNDVKSARSRANECVAIDSFVGQDVISHIFG